MKVRRRSFSARGPLECAPQAKRQLLFSEHPPRFDAVVDESVLHRVVGSPATMRAQLKRLLELSSLPRVTLWGMPYPAGALPSGKTSSSSWGSRNPPSRMLSSSRPDRGPVPRRPLRDGGVQHDT
jgi:hypothetical protein